MRYKHLQSRRRRCLDLVVSLAVVVRCFCSKIRLSGKRTKERSNEMKKYSMCVAVVACASLIAVGAHANTVVNLASYGVGIIDPTIIPPTGMNNTILNNMIGVYNGTLTSPIGGENYTIDQGSLTPAAPLPGSPSLLPEVGNQSGGTTSTGPDTIDLGAGGQKYLVVQWDGPQGADAVYYIGGLTGKIDLFNDLPDKSNFQISGYWLADAVPTVPDGGTTVVLLGAALSGLGLLRRKMVS